MNKRVNEPSKKEILEMILSTRGMCHTGSKFCYDCSFSGCRCWHSDECVGATIRYNRALRVYVSIYGEGAAVEVLL